MRSFIEIFEFTESISTLSLLPSGHSKMHSAMKKLQWTTGVTHEQLCGIARTMLLLILKHFCIRVAKHSCWRSGAMHSEWCSPAIFQISTMCKEHRIPLVVLFLLKWTDVDFSIGLWSIFCGWHTCVLWTDCAFERHFKIHMGSKGPKWCLQHLKML